MAYLSYDTILDSYKSTYSLKILDILQYAQNFTFG